jgi:hypothetical protein
LKRLPAAQQNIDRRAIQAEEIRTEKFRYRRIGPEEKITGEEIHG